MNRNRAIGFVLIVFYCVHNSAAKNTDCVPSQVREIDGNYSYCFNIDLETATEYDNFCGNFGGQKGCPRDENVTRFFLNEANARKSVHVISAVQLNGKTWYCNGDYKTYPNKMNLKEFKDWKDRVFWTAVREAHPLFVCEFYNPLKKPICKVSSPSTYQRIGNYSYCLSKLALNFKDATKACLKLNGSVGCPRNEQALREFTDVLNGAYAERIIMGVSRGSSNDTWLCANGDQFYVNVTRDIEWGSNVLDGPLSKSCMVVEKGPDDLPRFANVLCSSPKTNFLCEFGL